MIGERRRIWNSLLVAVLLAVLAFVSVGGVSAATKYVNPGDSIQDAVDSANPGDTIIVNSSTYYENVTVDRQLILRGNGQPVVDAGGNNGSVITLLDDGIVLDGFVVTNAGYDFPAAGIYVTSNNNLVINNTASYNDYGIYLESSSYNTLTGNTVSSNTNDGIYLWASSYNNLTGNNASNCLAGTGIYLYYESNNNNLTGNTVSYNDIGIALGSESRNNNLTGNTVSYNDYGIDLYSSNNNIYNNYFNNTDDNAYDDGTNTWNISKTPGINIIGGPYLGGNYWSDYAGTDTDGDGLGNTPYSIAGGSNQDNLPLVSEISCTCGDICVNEIGWWRDGGTVNASSTPIQAAVDNATENETICVQNGTYTENVDVDVDNLTIRSQYGAAVTTVQAASASGSVFRVAADWVTISGFNVTGATDAAGIYLNNVNHCTISNNTVSNNGRGIDLQSSSYNNLTGNTASNNSAGSWYHYGILLESSSYNNLVNNTASNNHSYGIYLISSSNNNLVNNTASNNLHSGIYLQSSSNNNNLTGNTASNNSNNGIWLQSSINYNNLTGNTVSYNLVGIYLYSSSSNNTIYNNYFNNTFNAIDSGNNTWNISKTLGINIIGGPYLGGNYWSDYAGTDTDMPPDGLGDTLLPYNSSGNIQNGGDYHPLSSLSCDCGDLCVNESGWWRDGGTFNASGTPIQAAVDNATENETICVQNGTYTENVVVNKPLTIWSQYGAANCFVNASDTSTPVLNVTADWVNISGFTVQNSISNAGILLWYVDRCTISENTVLNNSGGIILFGSINNSLTNNTVSNNDYGIDLAYSSSYNSLTNNTVSNNDYGIDLDSSNNNRIYNNYFNNTNNAYDDGTNTWNISKTPGINIIGGPYLGGNYWSNYAGTDTDGDGLGNTPYNISGGLNQDNLPLVLLLSCTCGDICVNEMGWWRHNDTFNENLSTPIQAAVDNATENETICVQNGTYTENVVVNESVTIWSQYGAANCIVNASNPESPVFQVNADWVTISGFTVQNSIMGILLLYGDRCTISENTVSNNTIGVVLFISINNNLTNNTVLNNNWGFYLQVSSINILTGNNVNSNYDSGIYLNDSVYNNISCNWVHNNSEYGFYLTSGSTNNTIENNNIIANGIYNDSSGGYEYNFYNSQSDNVSAMWNYWGMDGLNIVALINASIYDHYDNPDLGIVDFRNYIDSPSGCAPIPEAATVFLFSAGLLALVGYVWLGKKKK